MARKVQGITGLVGKKLTLNKPDSSMIHKIRKVKHHDNVSTVMSVLSDERKKAQGIVDVDNFGLNKQSKLFESTEKVSNQADYDKSFLDEESIEIEEVSFGYASRTEATSGFVDVLKNDKGNKGDI